MVVLAVFDSPHGYIFMTLTTTQEHIDKHNKTGECVCGSKTEHTPSATGLYDIQYCLYCDRKYVQDADGNTIHPDLTLKTAKEEGLYEVNYGEIYRELQGISKFMLEYIDEIKGHSGTELWIYDQTYVYVNEDGIATTLLIERHGGIKYLGTVEHFRHKGYGTETIKRWRNKNNIQKIKVLGTLDEAEEFYKKTPFKIFTDGQVL